MMLTILIIFSVLWVVGMIMLLITKRDVHLVEKYLANSYKKFTKQLEAENELLQNIRGKQNAQRELIKNTRSKKD